jgi:hypothetical protein
LSVEPRSDSGPFSHNYYFNLFNNDPEAAGFLV